MDKKRKILIIEDNQDNQILMQVVLKPSYLVSAAMNAKEAYHLITTEQFDLIILDVVLPDDDGYKICSKIRTIDSYKTTPVIFVTGNSELNDKLVGFSVGADDYIAKPINTLELKARVDARMRNLVEANKKKETKQFGKLHINYVTQRVSFHGSAQPTDIDLTRVEFKLLVYLTDHMDAVVSREQILNAVWSNNVNVNDRTVDTHVSKLRKKIADCGFKIDSVHGTGYRMNPYKEGEKAA